MSKYSMWHHSSDHKNEIKIIHYLHLSEWQKYVKADYTQHGQSGGKWQTACSHALWWKWKLVEPFWRAIANKSPF